MIADRVRMRMSKKKSIPSIPDYVIATDADFSGTVDGDFVYIGSEKHIIIPHKIKMVTVTKTFNIQNEGMFGSGASIVRGVATLERHSITSMRYMFYNSQATSLDLSSFDTSKVTGMFFMFQGSQATSLDLSNFETSNVTNMNSMFRDSSATTLDLSSFDTSNVTNMTTMFYNSQATSLDLSSFDTSKAAMIYMFRDSSATTGYARTQADADRFNASSNKPAGLTFVVK